MNNDTMTVGLDVHKKTIAVAVLYGSSDVVNEQMTLENTPEQVEKLVQRLTAKGTPRFCYEAGPCGFEVQRQMTKLGKECVVIAPSMTPRRPGDRVKTDRRDAEKLARLFRAGELTVIRVPSREEESARDLVRAREDVLEDRLRARHRLSKFLLRQGRVYRESRPWGAVHGQWLEAQHFEWESLQKTYESYFRTLQEVDARMEVLDQQTQDLAEQDPFKIPVQYLRCLKGIDTLSALTLATEVMDFKRFEKASSFMGFTGMVSSEYSSSERIRRGGITKAGNHHIRRVLVEAAWHVRHGARTSKELMTRRKGCPSEVLRIALRAQDRLYRKYWKMMHRGKLPQVTVVACARELSGFVWAIGQHFPVTEAA
jgi:transposase